MPRAATAVLACYLAAVVLLTVRPNQYADLHGMLDTGVAVLAGILSLLLWDMSRHTASPFLAWLSVAFGLTFALEFCHALVGVDWNGGLSWMVAARDRLRPATWSPSAYILPLATLGALWRLERGEGRLWSFMLAAAVVGGALFLFYQQWPPYSAPGLLGITRPTLVVAPLLWIAVALWAGRLKDRQRIVGPLRWAAVTLALGNMAMLYSRSPGDSAAMIAHLGKIAAYLVVMLWVIKTTADDMRERGLAEAALTGEVAARIAELTAARETLEREAEARNQAEAKVLAQLERLSLLHQITRAIGDRQDLASIYQVAVRSVEQQLPVDFAALCELDDKAGTIRMVAVGAGSGELGLSLALPEPTAFSTEDSGLGPCLAGKLLYEPDISGFDVPLQARLAQAGLQSFVAAPLQVESRTFGCFVAARRDAGAFSSADCEFLRQLSEHVALAAHQVQLHNELQAAYDNLRASQQTVMEQERLRALGQMASGIAHDINNALSPVALYTEAMLETEKGLSGQGRKQLEVIRRAVEDVSHTIGRMREFYRKREPQLAGAPVQLNDLAMHVIDLTRARWADMAMERGAVVRTQMELAENLPQVIGMESEIREALTNLVFNAIDAMPDGGQLTVRTARTEQPGWVRIDVSDTGVGMDEEARQRCMEPFFTTKGERGTGLGLAMVYGVAQRHGAEVDLTSSPGEGTTFSLIFPAAMRSATAAAGELAPAGPMRLLLVDDDPVVLKALQEALANDGHNVTTASDGRAGIDAFEAGQDGHPFDLVITDLGMPYINGRQVAAAIKSIAPQTPIILLTGWGQGMLSGVEGIPNIDLVLGKPPKLREVRGALARFAAGVEA
ncbi:ATP-binding protein [Phenylobacterium sp.]|uniref:hybrid sensor histidine kinase/response regulator n=1 Tax=Phenylobacterium sp. TaxID=1871053 RepID=UPI0025FCA5C7|nr:ATP-binding protein [Phenylobacterium sp.]